MSGTTARDLPGVSDLLQPDVRTPLTRLTEEVRRLLGFRGDRLDMAITYRAAVNLGWVAGPPSGGGNGGGGGGGGPGGGGIIPDLTPPPTPTGLSAVAGFSRVIVQWDAPIYTQGRGHGQTNIYAVQRPIPDTNPPPTFGDASLVWTVYGPSTITAIPSELNTHWHIWIKWQSVNGVESVNPAGGLNGVQTETGQDITQLLEILTGSITETQLFSTLGARINLIDGSESLAGSVSQRIKVERDRALAAEASIIIDVDALEVTVNNPTTGVVATAAALDAVELIVTNGTSGNAALATRTSSLETTVNNPTTGVAATAAALDTVELLVNNSTQGNVALAARTSSLEATVNNSTTGVAATAAALDVVELLVNSSTQGNVALASRASLLEATVNNPTTGVAATYAAVQVESSARAALDGSVAALYTVRVEASAAGRTAVGGFGLAATSTTAGGPRIDFGIRADRFWVTAPSTATGVADIIPFIINTTSVVENGVTIPAGIYMDAAYIRNLSAMFARFGTAVIDDGMIANLSAAKLTVGDGTVGGNLKSTNYVPGSAGWLLTPGGAVELSQATVRGSVFAGAGAIGGSAIGADFIRSTNYNPNVAGWQLKSDGSAEFGSATIRGKLKVAQIEPLRANRVYAQDTFGPLNQGQLSGSVSVVLAAGDKVAIVAELNLIAAEVGFGGRSRCLIEIRDDPVGGTVYYSTLFDNDPNLVPPGQSRNYGIRLRHEYFAPSAGTYVFAVMLNGSTLNQTTNSMSTIRINVQTYDMT